MNSSIINFNHLSQLLDNYEFKVKTELYDRPFRLTLLLSILFCGLFPLIFEMSVEVLSNYQKQEKFQVQSILEEANFALIKEKPQKALSKYQEALKLDKKNMQTNFEMAAFYISAHNFELAKPHIMVLEKSSNANLYIKALNGIIGFQQKNYKKAEALLLEVYRADFNQDWLIDYLGATLLANEKEEQAFKLAGWPQDCQINALAHADCMNRLANWHSKIINSEINEKALFHQKRQLIFIGESLRSLMRGLQEVDGNFRLQLIYKYQVQRKKLNLIYAEYALKQHLAKEKLSLKDLTKGEKNIIPI